MDTRSTFYQFILNMVQSNFAVERRGRIGHPCTIRKGQRPARFLSSFHRPQSPVAFNILRLLSMCKCDDHSDNFWPQLHRHDSVSVCSCCHARAKWFSRSLSVSLGVCPCACPMWCNMPQLGLLWYDGDPSFRFQGLFNESVQPDLLRSFVVMMLLTITGETDSGCIMLGHAPSWPAAFILRVYFIEKGILQG